MGGGHELLWADHSHIQTALEHKNNLNLNISTSQRSTWLLCSDTFKKWEQALRAGEKRDKSTFFGCQGKLRRERKKRDLEEWKGHVEDALENRAGGRVLEGQKCQKKFFSAQRSQWGLTVAHRDKGCGEREEGGVLD